MYSPTSSGANKLQEPKAGLRLVFGINNTWPNLLYHGLGVATEDAQLWSRGHGVARLHEGVHYFLHEYMAALWAPAEVTRKKVPHGIDQHRV